MNNGYVEYGIVKAGRYNEYLSIKNFKVTDGKWYNATVKVSGKLNIIEETSESIFCHTLIFHVTLLLCDFLFTYNFRFNCHNLRSI